MGRVRTISALAGLTLLALLTTPPPSSTTVFGATGKIAFETNRDGNYEIYVPRAGSARPR